MTITDVAEFVGVHRDTIKRWERRGALPQPKRSLGRHRVYTVRDAEQIKAILFPGIAPSEEV